MFKSSDVSVVARTEVSVCICEELCETEIMVPTVQAALERLWRDAEDLFRVPGFGKKLRFVALSWKSHSQGVNEGAFNSEENMVGIVEDDDAGEEDRDLYGVTKVCRAIKNSFWIVFYKLQFDSWEAHGKVLNVWACVVRLL